MFDDVTDLLIVNDEFTASLIIARSFQTQSGALRWRLRFETGLVPDVIVAVRLDAVNEAPYDYYLFPSIDLSTSHLRLQEDNALALDAYRFDSLDFFYSIAARSSFLEDAA